jgi:hypothetical protein
VRTTAQNIKTKRKSLEDAMRDVNGEYNVAESITSEDIVNPSGFADIQPGDVVMDFGCGGEIDVILASSSPRPSRPGSKERDGAITSRPP